MILLDIKALSKYLGIPIGTLYQWTSRRKIPYLKINGKVRFDQNEIDAWCRDKKVKEMEFARR